MTPTVEVVELKSQATLLAGSGGVLGTSKDPVTEGWADSKGLDVDFIQEVTIE